MTQTTEIFWAEGMENSTDQSSEFYCLDNGQTHIATVKHGEKRIHVVANGEMYILYPYLDRDGNISEDHYDVMRYTQDLAEKGIDSDKKLSHFLHLMASLGLSVYEMNNWFEVYDEDDDTFEGVVCDTLDDAIEVAKNWEF